MKTFYAVFHADTGNNFHTPDSIPEHEARFLASIGYAVVSSDKEHELLVVTPIQEKEFK